MIYYVLENGLILVSENEIRPDLTKKEKGNDFVAVLERGKPKGIHVFWMTNLELHWKKVILKTESISEAIRQSKWTLFWLWDSKKLGKAASDILKRRTCIKHRNEYKVKTVNMLHGAVKADLIDRLCMIEEEKK